ncbi:MAG: recombinase family protein [Planctomycetes bacterium]|nr:recombinase family protein [Planctomycetota bacterium]
MKQAVIYTRFSPRPNAGECMSCEFQEQKCRDYCDLHGMDVLAVYHDKNLSGKRTDNRPGLQEALVHVCKEKGVLVVYALARLARSTRDAISLSETLAKQQADLAIVTQSVDTSTAMGRAFFKIMAVIAELERETTGERTAAKLKQMLKEGYKVSSNPPYGWMNDPKNPTKLVKQNGKDVKVGGKLMREPAEQEIIELILRLNKQDLNNRQIGDELNRRGLKARVSNWQATKIQRIIDRYSV